MSHDELPNGWGWATPPELASSEEHSLSIGPFGSDLKVTDYADTGVPLIFVRNIRSEVFDGHDSKFVSKEKARQLHAHETHPGDLLITKMGDPPGDSALYPSHRPIGIITADCIRWKLASRAGEGRFFLYALRSNAVRQRVLEITKGVAQKKVSLERFKTVRIPVAPLPEQHRIVDAIEDHFSRLDEAVATLERVRRNLERYRASVLKAAVEGRLVPTEAEFARAECRDYEPASVLLERILAERRRRGEESGRRGRYAEPGVADASTLPQLPSGWCWATLDQLSVLIRNGYSKAPREASGVPILRINAVRPMRLDPNEVRFLPLPADQYGGFYVEPGDVLFTRYNGNPALVGVCGVVPTLRSPLVHPDKLIRVRVVDELVLPRFIEVVANTGTSRRHVEAVTRTTAGQAGISGSDLRNMPVPLAPLHEQSRIASEVARLLSTADASVVAVDDAVRRSSRLRQSILKWAFEGKLVAQDPSDEPAPVLLERIRAERTHGNENGRPARRRAAASRGGVKLEET